MYPFKNRAELEALTELARLRYLARAQWVVIALEILFGLQMAFVGGLRSLGFALVGLGVLGLVCPLNMTFRARCLERDLSARD